MNALPASEFREAVTALIEQAAAEIILPRFDQLDDDQVDRKKGGELVTVADIETEAFLVPRLEKLWPGSCAMGEETVAKRASALDLVDQPNPLWIIDPIDGTRNFAAGRDSFCVMIARLDAGETVEAWLYHPTKRALYWAAKGDGAWLIDDDGTRRLTTRRWQGLDASYGRMSFGFVENENHRRALKVRADRLLNYRKSVGSAGCEYCFIAEGALDYSLFTRLKVWDHAPGALLIREAGGAVQLAAGAEYIPQVSRGGMIVAANVPMAEAMRQILYMREDSKKDGNERISV